MDGLLVEDEEDTQDPGAERGSRIGPAADGIRAGGSAVPLFRNTQGNPWTIAAGGYRFIVIRETLGWDKHPVKKLYSCYTARHTFAHRMLSGIWNNGVGCSIETLAELMGNTPQVAFAHYGREWGQSYQDPLWRAIGVK